MSILERLEQMERRMLEMAARDSNHNHNQQQHHQQQQQHGSQLATPLPPPLPEDHEQVRMAEGLIACIVIYTGYTPV